jgi:hypothetical protein
MPWLLDTDKDTRVAACEVLGKLRARQALAAVTNEFDKSNGAERAAALASIASIGAPESQGLLSKELSNDQEPSDLRAQAALGLGGIGTESASRLLWQYAQDPDLDLAESAVDGLRLCSDVALRVNGIDAASKLRVASKVKGPLADSIVRNALTTAALELNAARAASGRPNLVSELVLLLKGPSGSDGEIADAAVASLMSTVEGKHEIESLSDLPTLAGIIERRRRLAG